MERISREGDKGNKRFVLAEGDATCPRFCLHDNMIRLVMILQKNCGVDCDCDCSKKLAIGECR
ncbi:unnamed protein product [Sphenostylis stenocarpa]|uniref:Uncharacterized protein n=1 Tax=Sphenostylis stenocarpa TaxID=92480 RepID=A0AA86VUF1_9FABA|nr:unnamed protein product [Sphenostylis stenocarpa]